MKKIEITKQDFEKWVPVAKSSHDGVYNKLMTEMPDFIESMAEDFLGDVGMKSIDKDPALEKRFARFVTVLNFLLMFEQNDVVLTPTGFGVVSNDQLAPASAQRVSAVHDALERDSLLLKHELITYLTHIEGWGETEQAMNAIQFPMWSLKEVQHHYGTSVGAAKFYEIINNERAAMVRIQQYVGEELIKRVLVSIRCATRDKYVKVGELMVQYVIAFNDGDYMRMDDMYRHLMYHLEKNLGDFPEYADSDEYQANISERYENKQEDSSFFFG